MQSARTLSLHNAGDQELTCSVLLHPPLEGGSKYPSTDGRDSVRYDLDMGEAAEQTRIKSVLVLDDDERTLSAMARTLRHSRKVFTASTTAEAHTLARRERPDLIVVDLRLGSSSGLDVVRQLKAEMPGSMFALVSGYLTVDATVAAVRAGADVVMTKPVTGGEIVRRIEDKANEPPPEAGTPTLAQAESEHIARVMADCNGNISEAARRLGIYRSSLQRRLRRLGQRS